MKLTNDMIRDNLIYYLSTHTPLTETQVSQQFDEWMLDFAEKIIDVREAQIIKLLEDYMSPHYTNEESLAWTEGFIYGGRKAIALIKGEQK